MRIGTTLCALAFAAVWMGFVASSESRAENFGALLRFSVLKKLIQVEGAPQRYGFNEGTSAEWLLKNSAGYAELERELREAGSALARYRGFCAVEGRAKEWGSALSPEEEKFLELWQKSKAMKSPAGAQTAAIADSGNPLRRDSLLPLESEKRLGLAEPTLESGSWARQIEARELKTSFARGVKNYWQGLDTCLKNAPASVQTEGAIKQFVTSFLSSEAITLAVYFSVTEEKDRNFFELGTDLFTQLVRYGVRSARMKPQQSFGGMYLNMFFVNGAMNAMDAGVYHLLSQRDQQSPEAMARHAYNQVWSASVSDWLGPSLYRVMAGMQCLHPVSRPLSAALNFGYLVVDSTVTAVYYAGRPHFQNAFTETFIQK